LCTDLDGRPEACPDQDQDQKSEVRSQKSEGAFVAGRRPTAESRELPFCTDLDGHPEACPDQDQRPEVRSQKSEGASVAGRQPIAESRELPFCTDLDGQPEACPDTALSIQQSAAGKRQAGKSKELSRRFTQIDADNVEQQVTRNKEQVETATGNPSTALRAGSKRETENGSTGSRETGNGKRATAVEFRKPRNAKNMGSPYVPLDSWIYPAFDRLIALGYVQSSIAGLRPWTRLECARLLAEAEDNLQFAVSNLQSQKPLLASQIANYKLPITNSETEAVRFYNALNVELAPERALLEGNAHNLNAQAESVYARFMDISGQPLTDGYHFGQTIYNDFGRPYAEGLNQITGLSLRSEAGPFSFYVRGEYQHAPTPAVVPYNVRAAIAGNDENPILPAPPATDTNRFRLLDSYLALNVKGFQLFLGKQSLWYGAGQSGPLIWSDNAEPIPMLRLSQNSPIKLPGILGRLGPIRSEFFLARVQFQRGLPGGYIQGQTLAVKMTPNLEFGYTRTVVFAISPQSLTWGTFWNAFAKTNEGYENPRTKNGDQLNSLEWTYRLPRLRDRVMLYGNALEEESPIFFVAPPRAAVNTGIYFPKLPKFPKLDLRLEGVYTNTPSGGAGGAQNLQGRFIYWDGVFHQDYTNNGYLIGNWIGREGVGVQGWSTYWLSPRSKLQVNFRRATVARDFLEGGHYTDFGALADLLIRPQLSLAPSLQYEQWYFPLLSPIRHSNLTASIQLTYWPKRTTW
jgi:hypothetical protein